MICKAGEKEGESWTERMFSWAWMYPKTLLMWPFDPRRRNEFRQHGRWRIRDEGFYPILLSSPYRFGSYGGWEAVGVSVLAAKGLPVVVVNPRQVRNFAKAMGLLAKTDKIDARTIARFAEA